MNPLRSSIDHDYERADAVESAREKYAQLLVSDIRTHGRADYELNGVNETLSFIEVMESFDGDDDTEAAHERFYKSRYDHDLKFAKSSNELHNEMNKHVEAMCMIVAEQVIS